MMFYEPVTAEVFAAAVSKVCGQSVGEKFLKNCLGARFKQPVARDFAEWFVWRFTPEGYNFWAGQKDKFQQAPQPPEITKTTNKEEGANTNRKETAAKLEVLCGKDCAERYLKNMESLAAQAGWFDTTQVPEGSRYWKLVCVILDAGEVSPEYVKMAELACGRRYRWAAESKVWTEAAKAWGSLHAYLVEAVKAKEEVPPIANVEAGLNTDRTLLEIARDYLRQEDARTLDERAQAKADAMRAALEGRVLMSVDVTTETHPGAANLFKPAYDGPGEDSGDALVGRVCYCWDSDKDTTLLVQKITEYSDEPDQEEHPYDGEWDAYKHARLNLAFLTGSSLNEEDRKVFAKNT